MYDEELEKSFIGNLILSNDIQLLLADISGKMKASDISHAESNKAYHAITELSEKGENINPMSLNIKGVDINYVAEVSELGISSNIALQQADKIHVIAKKRDLYNALQNEMKNIVANVDVETVTSELSNYLNNSEDVNSDTTKRIDDLVPKAVEEILSIKENGISGQTTGFKSIDKYTGGLLNGSLTIIGARPAMGKTAFALNMAEESAKKTNKPVLIISLEMNNTMLLKRMLAKGGVIESEKLRDGKLDNLEINRLTNAGDKLANMPIWFDDTPIQNIADIRSRVLKLKRSQGDLGMVLIDYLGLIETGNERNSNRVNEVSKISRGLKILSKEVNAPIVTLAQLSRGVEQRMDKRPLLSDLRDSGSIEQDADNVAFLYRDDYYRNEGEEQPNDDEISTVEFIIAKNRNGKRGTVELAFNKKYSTMSEMSYSKNDEW